MNARVAELCGLRQFRLVDAALADPGPGEVQVRIDAVGICGSDLHSYADGGVGDTPCRYPMVLGHEPAGTVVGVGAGVTGWSAGDRAAFEPAIYCYHCEFCRTGHHNVCANPVSYTHLDVYKRQLFGSGKIGELSCPSSVQGPAQSYIMMFQ